MILLLLLVLFIFLAGVATGCWLTVAWLDHGAGSQKERGPVVRYIHGQAPIVIEPPKPKDERKP